VANTTVSYASSKAACVAAESEPLLPQPPVVQLRPRLTAGIDDPVPQQQLRHPMPRPHQILPRGLTGPDQITRGFLRQAGYPHRHDLVQP
jgi:hypothetical protein